MAKYEAYVLYSSAHRKTYVGQTDNLVARFKRHNAGLVRSTKAYKPWTILHQESFESRADAISREQWFKSPKGRSHISSLLLSKM